MVCAKRVATKAGSDSVETIHQVRGVFPDVPDASAGCSPLAPSRPGNSRHAHAVHPAPARPATAGHPPAHASAPSAAAAPDPAHRRRLRHAPVRDLGGVSRDGRRGSRRPVRLGGLRRPAPGRGLRAVLVRRDARRQLQRAVTAVDGAAGGAYRLRPGGPGRHLVAGRPADTHHREGAVVARAAGRARPVGQRRHGALHVRPRAGLRLGRPARSRGPTAPARPAHRGGPGRAARHPGQPVGRTLRPRRGRRISAGPAVRQVPRPRHPARRRRLADDPAVPLPRRAPHGSESHDPAPAAGSRRGMGRAARVAGGARRGRRLRRRGRADLADPLTGRLQRGAASGAPRPRRAPRGPPEQRIPRRPVRPAPYPHLRTGPAVPRHRDLDHPVGAPLHLGHGTRAGLGRAHRRGDRGTRPARRGPRQGRSRQRDQPPRGPTSSRPMSR